MSQIFRRHRPNVYFLARYYGYQRTPDYYEILRIPSNSTQKEIREAFISLSKKLHPDTSEKGSHEEFIKVNEAYTVLSKESTRSQYDLNVKHQTFHHNDPDYYTKFASRKVWESQMARRYGFPDPHGEESAYERRHRNRHGFSPEKLGLMCLLFFLFGSIVQFLMIKRSAVFKQNKLMEKSSNYEMEYKKVRAANENKSINETVDVFSDGYHKQSLAIKNMIRP